MQTGFGRYSRQSLAASGRYLFTARVVAASQQGHRGSTVRASDDPAGEKAIPSRPTISLLLVEDSSDDAFIIKESLNRWEQDQFSVSRCKRLS